MSDSVPTLEIKNELELPKELKYTEYNSNTVINKSEVQLPEKAYSYKTASSKSSSSIEFNLPSINGGSLRRVLDHEIPITGKIAFKGVAPAFSLNSTYPIAVADYVLSIINGSSPTPLHTALNTIDQAPLSKIFNDREYTINNSSSVLQERFETHQIDAMIAMADIMKMENDGLEPFAAANGHFRPLSYQHGGSIIPLSWNANSGATVIDVTQVLIAHNVFTIGGTTYQLYNQFYDGMRHLKLRNRVVGTWMERRNAGRNIVKFECTLTNNNGGSITTSKDAVGYENTPVPAQSSQAFSADYSNLDGFILNFKIVIREQMWSQYFFNDYQHDRTVYNELLPASSLSIKYNINQEYLNQAFLQIGDNVVRGLDGFEVNSAGNPDYPNDPAARRLKITYSVSDVQVGDQSECKIFLQEQKVPIHFQDRTKAYKLMLYDQVRSQGRKDMTVEGNVFSATQEYANLSQVSNYMLLALPINKKNFLKAYTYAESTETPKVSTAVPESVLPSTFTLPITDLQITFGNETNLGTYGLDMYQLQKITYDNLQALRELKKLIVGESCPVILENQLAYTVPNNSGGTLDATAAPIYLAHPVAVGYVPIDDRIFQSNGVSNSSFVLLNVNKDLRLPPNMTASQILTYNMSIKASCDISKLPSPVGKFLDQDAILDVIANSGNDVIAQLDTTFYVRRMMTMSGSTYSTIYLHNVLISSQEYINLLTSFQENFRKMDKQTIFDSRLMIGGSMFGNVKKAVNWLAKRTKDTLADEDKVKRYADLARKGAEAIESFTGSGYAENHTVTGGRSGYAENHTVTGGRKPAAKKGDWRSLL